MRVEVAFANDEFCQKKQTEITDDQHDRQPRKMIPVNAEVVIEVLLDIADKVFAHIAKVPFQPSLLTGNLLSIRNSRQFLGVHYKIFGRFTEGMRRLMIHIQI
jgi:hypothetical protein